MNSSTTILSLLAAGLLVTGVALGVTSPRPAEDDSAPPVLPDSGVLAAARVVSATPFRLQQPAIHAWSAEQLQYDAGLLLVLAVDDSELLVRRQVAEPVLYVGAMPVERINDGRISGHVVALLPSVTGADGGVAAAGSERLAFLGQPALPEQIDARMAAAELARAQAAGLPVSRLGDADVEPLLFPDRGELGAFSATLVAQYAPDEQDLVRGLSVPRLTR